MKDIYSKHINGSKITGMKDSVAGLVYHNDYGTLKPSQYEQWLYNREANGTHVNGWASIYIDKDECLWYHPTDRVEWHCANDWANRNLIGIEIVRSHPDAGLSDKEFMLNEEAAFKKGAAILKSYDLPVNRDTINLHREYFATACPHRSWDIHVGKNAPNTRANQIKLLDYFIERTKYYYDGKDKTPTKKAPAKTIKKVATSATKANATIASAKVYTVKQGDNLWRIAVNNKVDFEDLLKWNNLKKDSVIAVGQKLKLSAGAVKQKAPAKVTSTVAKKGLTKSEAMKLLETLPKKWIDNDNFPVGARFQCMDVAVWWCKQITNGAFKLEGNARDAINDKLPEGWKLIKNDPDVVPEVGDLIIYSKGWADNEYGHIAIVFKNPTLTSVIVAEQNWNGLGNTPVMTRLDYYDGASYFIRPKYA